MSLHPKATANQRAASDPHVTAWVNANAGSGKTHVLVNRVIRLLLGSVDPSRIMCLTFTKAAAAEMANRLFERLSAWIALDDEALTASLAELGADYIDGEILNRARQLFTRALETPGGLKIQTIHAFCERVLQLFPVEAGIVPHFTMLDDRAAGEMLEEARDRVLLEAQSSPQSPLGVALLDVANRVQADQFDKLMSQLLAKRADLRAVLDPETGLNLASAVLHAHLNLAPDETAEHIRNGLTLGRPDYQRYAAALDGGSKTDRERADNLRAVLARRESTLLDLRDFYLTQSDAPRKISGLATKGVLAKDPWIETFVEDEQKRLTAALGTLGDIERTAATLSLLRIGAAVVAAFEAAKRQQGAYDFDDLIIRTSELLADRPDAAWVLYKLDGGIEHLLVDEAQDTSPAQWKIIRALTEEFFAGEGRHAGRPRTVFVVGDRKQSIYSFQGADPDVFLDIHDEFERRVESAGGAFRDVDFTVSFRSVQEILDAVDDVFHMQASAREGLDGRGRPARDWNHESTRRPAEGVVELWPLMEPLEAESDDPWQAPVDREPAQSPRRRLALHLARTIKHWIGRRIIVALGRPVAPQDILILVRSRNVFFDALIRALWTEGVPVAGADRLKLGENIAVLDLLALAQFALMPEDDHALACILKSPVFTDPVTEDELIALAHDRGGTSLWQRLNDSDAARCRSAADLLSPLIATAPTARPFEFYTGVLATARTRFLKRLGSEANDAIDAFLDMALTYEEGHPTSLAGFVNWFSSGDIEIKRNMEQGAGEVRIMTVHGAKGLEAPIVILPDTTSVPDHRNADPLLMLPDGHGGAVVPLWPAPHLFVSEALGTLKNERQTQQTDEYQRLLYVAMTRAREELYVCGYRGSRKLSPACWYNTIEAGLQPKMAAIAEYEGWRSGADPVYREGGPAVAATESRPPMWINRPAMAAPRHPAPPRAPKEARSTARVARGILIHRILQQMSDLPEQQRDAHIAQMVDRAGYEPALADELSTLVHSPAFAEVFASDGLSEVPLMVDGPDGRTERRQIDRLVMTENDLLIVDYKTDRAWPGSPWAVNPDYLAQLAAYRAALRKIHPGVPLRMALLWTEAPTLMVVPGECLDSQADQLSVSRS